MSRMTAVTPLLSEEKRDQWQNVQDSFARITGLSVWTIDPEGRVIGRPSSPAELCLLLRKNRSARAICNRDCIHNCQRALRSNATVFFRCHGELQCFAAPLRSSGKPVGVILAGQVLTGPPPLERYRRLAGECRLPEDELLKAVSRLTIGTEKTLCQAAEFVAEMAEVIFSGWESHTLAARKLTLLTNLFSVGSEFSPEMDPHEIYALALNSLSILFDLASAALFIEEPRDGSMAARYALGPHDKGLMKVRLDPHEGFIQDFYQEAEPFATDEYHFLLRAGFPEAVKQACFFPLFAGERLTGLLGIFNHVLQKEEVGIISSFAGLSSLTIQNAILREDLKRKVASLTFWSRFNEKLAGTLEKDPLLALIFDEAAGLAKAEKASLMLMNEKTHELMIKLVKGEKEEVLKRYSIPEGEGLAGYAARVGKAILVKDMERDSRFHRPNRPNYRTSSCVILPLKAAGRTIGVLNITDKITGEIYTEDDLEMLRALAAQATVALERSELYELSRELKKISITDSLTNLLNRRYFQERATEEIERSKRFEQPLSLVMIDVDDFKFYNDLHGHLAGDEVLKSIGGIVKAMVRSIDVVSRFGGEEFAVLSPNTPKFQAFHIAERVRQGIDEYVFSREKEQPTGNLTVSTGVATFPADALTLEDLINNADKALYLSKKAGKNLSTSFGVTA